MTLSVLAGLFLMIQGVVSIALVRVSVRTVLDVKLNNKNPRSHRLTILLKRLRIEMP